MVPSSTVASDKINIVTEDAEPTRRQRILRAAMGLFVARGYAGTSTLAIASAARVLDAEGRAAGLDAMVGLLRAGQVAGLLGGEAAERMAGQYFSLLMGDVILQHLLGLAPRESEAEARGRAEFATWAMLRLNVPGGAI